MILFIVGLIIGVILMCLLQISKEADRRNEIKVKVIKDEQNKKIKSIKISKLIATRWYVNEYFSDEEAEVAKRVLNYFKEFKYSVIFRYRSDGKFYPADPVRHFCR